MSTPTLIRPVHPDSLPSKVFTIKQDKAYCGTRRYCRKGHGMTQSHVIVFQQRKDAKALQRLFMDHRTNMDDWAEVMDDNWQMQVKTCHTPYDGKLDVQQEDMCELMQLGLDNIVINVVYDMRVFGGVVEFNTRTVEPKFDIQNIRQHYTDMWDRLHFSDEM